MWAAAGGPLKPVHVRVQFRVDPSELSWARKVPCPPVPLGRFSLKLDSRADKRRTSLSSLLLACVEKFPNNRTAKAASAILMHSFFISCSFLSTKKTAERKTRGVGVRSADG